MTYANDQTYYGKEVMPPSPIKWSGQVNTEIKGSDLQINPQGYASIQLESTYANALKASKRRLVRIGFKQISLTELNNYKNLVYLLLKISYNNQAEKQYIIINITIAGKAYNPSTKTLTISQVIEMKDYDLDSCEVTLYNKGTEPLLVNYVRMYRSQDISPSQVGEAIGWGVTLREVKAYSDGCKLYYEGSSVPDNVWYMEKDGKFAGLNINNERVILFSRINEPLIDDGT